MTFQALVSVLAILLPHRRPDASLDDDGVPRWEKHPEVQRHLRQQARTDADRWLRIPRGY
jgi:hypothetical protein